MPSAEQLPSGRWRGVYRDATGRRRSKTFDHKRPALRWATVEEDRASRGGRAEPGAGRMPWGTWYDRWAPTRNIAASTRHKEATKVRQHVRPRWEAVPLVGITRLDVQRWVTAELPAAGLSASSVRQCFYVLSSSMKAALHEGLVDVNPCTGVRLPTLPPGRERYLSDAEFAQLRYHLNEPYRMLVDLLLGTGLRLSEACGLHRARIDLAGEVLRVREVWDADDRTMVAYPKGKRARTVPLPEELADRLHAWMAERPASGACGQRHAEGRCPGPLLLVGPSGHGVPIDPHNFTNRTWAEALRTSGVEHCTPHDLRHTYASRLVQDGVDLTRVRDILGHASIKTTERYAHLIPDQFDAVRAVLNKGRRGTPVGHHDTAPDSSALPPGRRLRGV